MLPLTLHFNSIAAIYVGYGYLDSLSISAHFTIVLSNMPIDLHYS